MYLKEVEAKPAEGAIGDMLARMRAAGRPIPQIWHLFAYKADRTRHLADFTQAVMRGPSPLTPGMRELIAAFTSSRNECAFCCGSHTAGAAEVLGDHDLVQAVLNDYRTAPLSDAEKALLGLVEKVTRTAAQVTQEDIDAVKRAGWSDEAIYDAITVCALFNFYNRWINATGIHDMSPAAYAQTGKRLAERGYTTFGSGPGE